MQVLQTLWDICIEGNPFITRFKTTMTETTYNYGYSGSIEGNPFITRFKTVPHGEISFSRKRIEGNPFITRFKTLYLSKVCFNSWCKVLKVIHL